MRASNPFPQASRRPPIRPSQRAAVGGGRPGQTYYWIVANWNGRTVLLGPEESEDKAMNLGYSKLDGHFDVVALPTRDRHAASGMLKARKLNQTGDLGAAMEKVRHKIPQDRKAGGTI